MGNCYTMKHHQKTTIKEPAQPKVRFNDGTNDGRSTDVYLTASAIMATEKQQRGGGGRAKMKECEEKWESDEGKGATRREVVKVRITKQQLEQLRRRIDVKGLTVKQLLDHLMNVSESHEMMMMRSWRPRLESIPEI
ncbi:hypothetical protein Droror1_Dr00014240 [Drosera rotundifolia]